MRSKTILFGLFILTATIALAYENPSVKKAETTTNGSTMGGSVIDKLTGEPLVGVEVSIEGAGLKTYTDFDGNFSFEGLTPGKYTISAFLISYQNNQTQSVTVIGGTTNLLNLKLDSVGL